MITLNIGTLTIDGLSVTGADLKVIVDGIKFIQEQNAKIIMTQEEVVAQINEAVGSIQKIGAESAATLQKVTDLETVVAGLGTGATPELVEAVANLRAQVQTVDDLIPDVPSAPIEGVPVDGEPVV